MTQLATANTQSQKYVILSVKIQIKDQLINEGFMIRVIGSVCVWPTFMIKNQLEDEKGNGQLRKYLFRKH